MSVFEIMMLVCFGAAWPFSIYKSYISKSTAGKSIVFLTVLFIGYAFGILHKIVYSYDSVIYLYVFNFMMVCIDMLLYLRNKNVVKED
ncbi:MAG: hypothetical protein MJB12_13015 [Firmicutes bacterium]|nr:hypothetical protein [Bacillota bacterium]